ncbi:hypothetical protein Scep_027268 [Stephania cephalantha]|uniref:Uncharacterized protein n=1 Tax=Stephania cephalantha TaxID=152367 RepID=A0AAP0HKX8_9MAGN
MTITINNSGYYEFLFVFSIQECAINLYHWSAMSKACNRRCKCPKNPLEDNFIVGIRLTMPPFHTCPWIAFLKSGHPPRQHFVRFFPISKDFSNCFLLDQTFL